MNTEINPFAFKIEKRPTKDGKGFGLFALEFIPKGSLIWHTSKDSCVQKMTREKFLEYLKQFSFESQKNIVDHCWFEGGFVYFSQEKDGEESSIVDMMNHSSSPNTFSPENELEAVYALKDINVDEELVEDYSKYEWDEWYLDLHKKYGLDVSYINM